MKFFIIPDDGTVNIDNVYFEKLNLSSCGIPNNVHALQWKDNTGWIEFVDNLDKNKPANEIITEIPIWAKNAINKWNEAKSAADNRIAATSVKE